MAIDILISFKKLKTTNQNLDKNQKRILVAPLNWGLGHATRCIPIINALIELNFEPVIASDGVALQLLKKEFPSLAAFELPSYNITYSKKANGFKTKLIKDSPHLLKTIKKEKKAIAKLIEQEEISGIISDNRFGVRHKSIPSVFITHQLRVLSGSTTWFSSKMHQKIILKFDECWVPDHSGISNLSGKLGHVDNFDATIKYLGPLTRFKKQISIVKYELLVLLSGPEPQRTFLEEKLLNDLNKFEGKVLFVKGKIEAEQHKDVINDVTVFNFMTSKQLETAINESKLVLSRSGYTTIMDLAKLEKKAFFIPTPGQFEQEYLAKKLDSEGVTPYCEQDSFDIKLLKNVDMYSGFKFEEYELNYHKLFRLF